MAPFQEFRELAAWRLAHQMNLRVDLFLGCPEFRQHFKSCRQLCDAARSGPRNIAEGSAMLKHKDFAQFVRNAKESEIQVLTHLVEAYDQRLISTDELLINTLLAKRAVRAASGLIRYLESTPDQ
jgi:four helix bundle protein